MTSLSAAPGSWLLSTLASYVAAMSERLRLVAEFPDRPPVELTGIGGESEGKAAPEGRGHKMSRAAVVHSGTTGAPTGPMKIRRSWHIPRTMDEADRLTGLARAPAAAFPVASRPVGSHLRPA